MSASGARSMSVVESVNPANEEVVGKYKLMSPEEVDARVGAAAGAQQRWGRVDVAERAGHLRSLAAQLHKRRSDLAWLITTEMGKPLEQARAEVDKSAFCFEYYAENGPGFLADRAAPADTPDSRVAFRPVGVVLALMPWNYPLWQVVRALAPALIGGNTVVLKHAANVTGCALLLQDVVEQAGLPPGALSVVVVRGGDVAPVIADPRIRAVTLTGSDTVGVQVAKAAGEQLKKCVLELGGSDAFIVLEDADVEAAAATAVHARFLNAGQSCIAAKRFIVVDAVADRFTEAFVEGVRQLRVGDPVDETTTMGPMARQDLRVEIEGQLARSLSDGARLLTGGSRPYDQGWFYAPTVVEGCDAATTCFRQETFGPLAGIAQVRDTGEAIALANDSVFGLAGALWTADEARLNEISRELETGALFLNGMSHSDPRLPFGGVKRSGYGRELADFGVREFVNVQTLWAPPPAGTATPTPTWLNTE
jgi:acyl-CoA reductase-like NAD-dependent aldehyde dehydrogenase